MKIQCNCGAKYAFDVTDEMGRNPIRFVCPSCGLDSSEMVNGLIRQELGVASATPASSPRPVSVAPPPAPRATPVAAPAPVATVAPPSGPLCGKHRQDTVEVCRVCSKPICPQCMSLFGYACSPLCRARARSAGVDVAFAGEKSVMEARRWRKIGWTAGSIAGAAALFFGIWFWYAWFGCTPKVVFSVRFPEKSFSGMSSFAGLKSDQVIFLHGDTLARYEVGTRKKIWAWQLIDRKRIAQQVQEDLKEAAKLREKLETDGFTNLPRMSSTEELEAEELRSATEALQLRVIGENIWVFSPEKISLYDWATGKEKKSVQTGSAEFVERDEEIFLFDALSDTPKITRIHLKTGEVQSAELPAMEATGPNLATASLVSSGKTAPAALPRALKMPAGSQPLDPAKLAEQVQGLPIQAKFALPALLAARLNQERLMAELDDTPVFQPAGESKENHGPHRMMIPTREGIVAMTVTLLESRIVERSAMKAPPAKSTLDSSPMAYQSLEVANEMLNEVQRSRGLDKVREDLSRYQVTLETVEGKTSWNGEVVGPPRLMPLETVNILAASKSITVFDKNHKVLWQSKLGYDVPSFFSGYEVDEDPEFPNTGPCIEREDTLYVFDEGVLSAFELKTGKARWRLPTVGIAGIYFDESGSLYVNTTTASHEKLKYSRQIDLSDVPGAVVIRVDPKNGKALWRRGDIGWISRIQGKHLFAVASYTMPEDEEDLIGTSFHTGLEKRSFLRIRRINPKTGSPVWEHFEERAPLHMEFEKNYIRLVFRKEVEILKYPTF